MESVPIVDEYEGHVPGLQRLRAEYTERSFAHAYGTGGMRRTHLRGQANIYKRLCMHGGAFNLGLVMRKITGMGTPRGLHSLMLSPFRAIGNLLKAGQGTHYERFRIRSVGTHVRLRAPARSLRIPGFRLMCADTLTVATGVPPDPPG